LPEHTLSPLRWAHPTIVGGEIEPLLPPSGCMHLPDLPGTDHVASMAHLDAPNAAPSVRRLHCTLHRKRSRLQPARRFRQRASGRRDIGQRGRYDDAMRPWSNLIEVRRP
jgi:hypothetical protein